MTSHEAKPEIAVLRPVTQNRSFSRIHRYFEAKPRRELGSPKRTVHVSRLALGVILALGLRGVANASVYHGFPHLHLTVAVVDAGGGGKNFDSHRLVKVLAGADASAENAKLIGQYGSARVQSFYSIFTFAVGDATKKAHNMLIPLPRRPEPDPANGRALATALYGAGVTPSGRYDVGYMLEELMSHQIHHDIMVDMDKKFGPAANADFHVILTTAMNDLKHKYRISAG